MRSKAFILTIIFSAVLLSCNRHETPITGSYGDRVLSGQVVMAGEMTNGSPAGVEVSVVGTGMTATLGAEGRFTFVGVPANAELMFHRADGIDSRLRLSGASRSIVLEVSASGVKETNGNGHGRRRASSKKDPAPSQQFEGTLVGDATAELLTIHDSHGNDVPIVLTETTLIRKGDRIVPATDLKDGDRVHVKATMVNDVLTASQVIVQNPDDDDEGQQKEFEGLVVTASATSLEMIDSHGNDVTFVIDTSTVVRKGNQPVDPATLKEGDRVHVKAAMVNDVLTATEVIVQNTNNDDDDDDEGTTMTANGLVLSVSGSGLVVRSQSKGDVTVNVDSAKTIIKKQGNRISLSDIHENDQVNTMGTRVDDHTLDARKIEVRGVSGH